ncbi:MAG: hypothetical protein FWD36_00505 [Treponema sp.]|nr:hypothetical protein [Treponema sp.]
MKNIIIVTLAALLLGFSGCSNLGEDPLPSPGPNPDGSVTLFVNGSVYNFDYTAKYDGIELAINPAETPAGGGLFTSMSTKGQWFAGGRGLDSANPASQYASRYNTNGISSMEWRMDLPGNDIGGGQRQEWRFTLFDTKPIFLDGKTQVTLWVKYVQPVPGVAFNAHSCNVGFQAYSSSGYRIANASLAIPNNQRNQQWYRHTVQLDTSILAPVTIPDPEDTSKTITVYARVPFPKGEALKQWSIGLPPNSGRVFVDEIVIE